MTTLLTNMGTFRFTLEQKEELGKILKSKKTRSSKKIFSPSILHNLSEEQKVCLDKEVIRNDDILSIGSVNLPSKKYLLKKAIKKYRIN